MALDSTKPTENELIRTWSFYLREARAKINALEASFLEHITGVAVYVPTEITTSTHSVTAAQTFIKANAGIQPIIITVNPAALTDGIMYVIKKTDSTANTITVRASTGTYINDTASEVVLNLQQESVRFISDGVGIQTC